jgi:hypothetical protein
MIRGLHISDLECSWLFRKKRGLSERVPQLMSGSRGLFSIIKVQELLVGLSEYFINDLLKICIEKIIIELNILNVFMNKYLKK